MQFVDKIRGVKRKISFEDEIVPLVPGKRYNSGIGVSILQRELQKGPNFAMGFVPLSSNTAGFRKLEAPPPKKWRLEENEEKKAADIPSNPVMSMEDFYKNPVPGPSGYKKPTATDNNDVSNDCRMEEIDLDQKHDKGCQTFSWPRMNHRSP